MKTMGKMLRAVRRKLAEMSHGWSLWLTLSMLAGVVVFLIPTPPGAFTIAFLVVLGVGKVFFIRTRLKARDIFISLMAFSAIMFVYTAYSLMVIASISLVKILVVGVVMDAVAIPVYHFIGVGRILPGLGKFAVVAQRLIAISIQSLIAVWAFQSAGAFMFPIIITSNLFRVGLHPTTTYLLIVVKLIGSAF